MPTRSNQPFAPGLGAHAPTIDDDVIARVTIEASNGLEEQSDDDGSIGASVTAALKKLGSMISGILDDKLTQLSTAMGKASNEVASAEADVDACAEVVDEKKEALKRNEARLKEVNLQLKSGGGTASKFGVPRSIPTPFYLGLLVVASLAIATFNVPSFRVLGLPDSLSVVLAAVVAAVYGTAIHLLPRGFGESKERGAKFWLSIVILLLQLASTILLAMLRQDYLVILEVTLEPWGFIALPLLADSVALLASFLHEADAATALRRAERRAQDAKDELEAAEDLLRDAQEELGEARERRFSLVDSGIREIHKIHEDGAEDVLNSFIMKLLTLRPMKASLLQSLELPVRLPEDLAGFEEWLVEEGAKLNRPVRLKQYAIHVVAGD